MTPIGHTLTGLAIGVASIPSKTPGKQKAWLLAAFAVLASAPDLPIPYWGHSDYRVSHNLLGTTLGVMLLESFLGLRFRGRPPVTKGVMIGMALAWYSHLLLDSFYNHRIGLLFLWPFSNRRFALPVPWLSIGNKSDVLSMHNVKVALLEILTFGPLLILAVLFTYYLLPRRRTKQVEMTSSVS